MVCQFERGIAQPGVFEVDEATGVAVPDDVGWVQVRDAKRGALRRREVAAIVQPGHSTLESVLDEPGVLTIGEFVRLTQSLQDASWARCRVRLGAR